MSRSPLFARVSRALHLAQYCERQSIPTQDGLERAAMAQRSRREFTCMAAASVALTPPGVRAANEVLADIKANWV